jgi:hypothetical protein
LKPEHDLAKWKEDRNRVIILLAIGTNQAPVPIFCASLILPSMEWATMLVKMCICCHQVFDKDRVTCSECSKAIYCSKECLSSHAPVHKMVCAKLKENRPTFAIGQEATNGGPTATPSSPSQPASA